ncbi:MAG: DUF4440 domain-containing protein [Chitinophagales bacterium]|nr:DUF4440 domain-containing protein [Chitinophagales bacterium]
MKKYLITIACFGCLFCQAQNSVADNKDVILDTDRSFCSYALEHGINKAFLFYADDSIVRLNNGELPVRGKTDLTKQYGNDAGTKNISWYPVDGEVARSGEMGYTWGNWKFTSPDTIFYGNYVTVWKKQQDGTWKVLLDGGNDTPAPADH